MAKFLSHDGVDKNGVRAEVMVQTGTGRIKDLVGRGRAGEDGTFRNIEVVFEPDNPHLKRKVYALLDTTGKELWEYVQAAHADKRDVSYRIESQRKRGIDRTKPFTELVHTEEAVRILAAIDDVFSHEAKTNPKEDPSQENPSALTQDDDTTSAAPAAVVVTAAPAAADPSKLLASLAAARQAGMPATTVDTLAALALAAGAGVDDVASAGFDDVETPSAPRPVVGRTHAVEDKPWNAYNSDGRVNVGSYMVAHAASAERFALDHLITVYSEGKKTAVDVSDAMIAQAASVALVLLEMSDEVLIKAVGGRVDRQKNSYNRAMSLVLDAVDKRYHVPVGANNEARAEWRAKVVAEAAERLYGITEVAQGRLPRPESERNGVPAAAPAPAVEAVKTVDEASEVDEVKPAAKKTAAKKAAAKPAAVVADVFGETTAVVSGDAFKAGVFPAAEEATFIAPDELLVGRLRDLCSKAGVAGEAKAVSDWLERAFGVRATRKVHAPVLESFIDFYEKAGAERIRTEVLGAAA